MLPSDISVSVILPTYNRASLLPRSIESVLRQTYGDLELVIVDDGSQDETAATVKSLSDKRIRYVKLPQNRGLPAARNAGLAVARGEYIAFQDSDDEWHADKLQRQIKLLEQSPGVAVVYSDMHRVRADGQVMYFRSPTIVSGRFINPATRFWQTYMLAMQPVLMRRVCLENVFFDERLAFFEDLDVHLRIAQRHEFLHMREPLVSYYETNGLTSDRRKEIKGRWQLLRKHASALLKSDPGFIVTEAANVLLRNSLLPIVNEHITAM